MSRPREIERSENRAGGRRLEKKKKTWGNELLRWHRNTMVPERKRPWCITSRKQVRKSRTDCTSVFRFFNLHHTSLPPCHIFCPRPVVKLILSEHQFPEAGVRETSSTGTGILATIQSSPLFQQLHPLAHWCLSRCDRSWTAGYRGFPRFSVPQTPRPSSPLRF